MKKTFLLISLFLCQLAATAQDDVNFEFSDGITGQLKTKMEQQLSRLLTAINQACSAGSDEINFSNVQFERSETANQTISMLWTAVHFRTQDDDIYETCLQKKQGGRVSGYEVRKIYMDMIPVDDSYTDATSREFVVNFDATGRIADVKFAMDKLQYEELIREGQELDDLDRRQQIIDFCEQFANAYCKYDLQFMEDVFSEDALIITGTVRKRAQATISARVNPETGERMPNDEEVTYTSQTKKEYLNKLRGIFNRQKNSRGGYLSVKFDDYSIVRHGSKPNYYGVTLRQKWSTPGYKDEGIVFLVWDFTDEDHPQIQVRTWQPVWATKRFTLGSFRLR